MKAAAAPGLFGHEVRWRFTPAERKAFDFGSSRTTVEWAEKEIRLPPSITELHGAWRVGVTPYAAEPMNLWDDAHVRRTVKCWAPQTAKTMTSYLPALRRLARGQGPALLVMSSEAGARKMFRDYVTPICLASPGLKDIVSTAKEDLTSSTIRLLGDRGRFDAAWATSLSRLKSQSYRITLGDEVEDWPEDVEGGGDPEALLDVRMRFYPHTSRMELVSSPGRVEGVWAKMLGCQEVRVYLAKCPHCGAEQRMTWPAKGSPWFPRWAFDPKLDPARIEGEYLAAYVCARCESHWSDGDRDRAVKAGRWQAVDKRFLHDDALDDPFPEPPAVRSLRPVSVGYHLAAWYSRLVPLSKVAAEFLRAHREPDPSTRRQRLKTWTNNYPALPWEDAPPAPVAVASVLALRDERPAGVVPSWGAVLVLTADVQEDGIWYELRAWGADKTSAGVRHGFLARSLGGDFSALEAVLDGAYPGPDGAEHRVRFGLVDSGYRTDEVYEFCRRVRRLAPSKGYDARRTPLGYARVDVLPGTGKLLRGGLQRVDVDTGYFKTELARLLQVGPSDPGAWRLHAGTDEAYARQLTSEYWDPGKGAWLQRGHQANHLWDCGVLQLAAVQILETQGLFAQLARASKGAEPAEPTKAEPKRPEGSRLW